MPAGSTSAADCGSGSSCPENRSLRDPLIGDSHVEVQPLQPFHEVASDGVTCAFVPVRRPEVAIGPAVAKQHIHDCQDRVGDGERRLVGDGAGGGSVLDGSAPGVAEGDGERLGLLLDRVLDGGDGDGLRRLAGREPEGSRGGGVVGAQPGGPVGGGVVDGDGLGAGPAQGDEELGRVSLLDGVVGDVEQGECGDGPVVVGDGPVAVPSWMPAPPGLPRVTVKVSVCSWMSSSTVGTEIVLELSLAAKVSDREVCV